MASTTNMNMNEALCLYINEDAFRSVAKSSSQFAKECIRNCAKLYKFDERDAIEALGLKTPAIQKVSKSKPQTKPKFPLPYSQPNASLCDALRYNRGLMTQCHFPKPKSGRFCASCIKAMEKKNLSNPHYGTVQERSSVGIYEYVDPNGKSPVRYSAFMKRYSKSGVHVLTKELVLEEASRLGVVIDEQHFEEVSVKKGRPSTKNIVVVRGDEDDDEDEDEDEDELPISKNNIRNRIILEESDEDEYEEARDEGEACDEESRDEGEACDEETVCDEDEYKEACHEETAVLSGPPYEMCEDEFVFREPQDVDIDFPLISDVDNEEDLSEYNITITNKPKSSGSNKTMKKKYCRESEEVYWLDTTTDEIVDRESYEKHKEKRAIGKWDAKKKTCTLSDGRIIVLHAKK